MRTSQWEGLKSADQGDEIVEQGPIISILHPKSTAEHPRQEIPIMVFTIPQWDWMQAGEWHVGAAPILPLELGRNSRYVFALPARSGLSKYLATIDRAEDRLLHARGRNASGHAIIFLSKAKPGSAHTHEGLGGFFLILGQLKESG